MGIGTACTGMGAGWDNTHGDGVGMGTSEVIRHAGAI